MQNPALLASKIKAFMLKKVQYFGFVFVKLYQNVRFVSGRIRTYVWHRVLFSLPVFSEYFPKQTLICENSKSIIDMSAVSPVFVKKEVLYEEQKKGCDQHQNYISGSRRKGLLLEKGW